MNIPKYKTVAGLTLPASDIIPGHTQISIHNTNMEECADYAKLLEESGYTKYDEREFSAGMAELIKCAMINDAQFFSELESLENPLTAEHEFLPRAIQKACAMKARIVSADEKETAKDGGRALLNLGHTFGHAIEKCAGFGQWLHGEAVAMGIVMCMIYSKKLGIFAESDFFKVKKLLESYNLPTSLNPKLDASKMLESMFHDKKTESGKLRLVLLNGIGKAFTQVGNPELAENTITEFLAS